jgi:cysteine synthase A
VLVTSFVRSADPAYLHRRLAAQIPGAVWANQFDNVANRKAHYDTTAPEIVASMPNVDAFSCAAGTGGTIAGCSMCVARAACCAHCHAHCPRLTPHPRGPRFFKEKYPHVKVGLTDPKGANLHRWCVAAARQPTPVASPPSLQLSL